MKNQPNHVYIWNVRNVLKKSSQPCLQKKVSLITESDQDYIDQFYNAYLFFRPVKKIINKIKLIKIIIRAMFTGAIYCICQTPTSFVLRINHHGRLDMFHEKVTSIYIHFKY